MWQYTYVGSQAQKHDIELEFGLDIELELGLTNESSQAKPSQAQAFILYNELKFEHYL